MNLPRPRLIVPGLIWPTGQGRQTVRDLPLPALHRLLGRSRRRALPFMPYENRLAQLFGVDDADAPLAAWRRLGEMAAMTDEERDAHWLCADPVHLFFAREHLLLDEIGTGELDAASAATLTAALNASFPELGHFSAPAPERWYLRLEHPARAHFSPLRDVIGPVQHFMPAGDQGRHWQHALNEIQTVLHNHPLNQNREAQGQRMINSLWFWGCGSPPKPTTTSAKPRAPCAHIQANDPMTRGLARAAGTTVDAPNVDTAIQANTLVILDTLDPPARRLDLDTWQTRLAACETDWFAPLLRALDSGRIGALDLLAPADQGTLDFVIGRHARWHFWRRPQALDKLLDPGQHRCQGTG
ncbi:MAG: hypothetical protein LBB76_04715 [Azoarcus sp.]|jgi:hypothetical protein|nr:hypothetical protein [Azoarcus sp.]